MPWISGQSPEVLLTPGSSSCRSPYCATPRQLAGSLGHPLAATPPDLPWAGATGRAAQRYRNVRSLTVRPTLLAMSPLLVPTKTR